MPSRIIVVGNIHGCSTVLDSLIHAVPLIPTDTIVSLGRAAVRIVGFPRGDGPRPS